MCLWACSQVTVALPDGPEDCEWERASRWWYYSSNFSMIYLGCSTWALLARPDREYNASRERGQAPAANARNRWRRVFGTLVFQSESHSQDSGDSQAG